MKSKNSLFKTYPIIRNLNHDNGFTLIELLVVLGIIAMIIGLLLVNMVGSRQRARDSKRKMEMAQLKTALRLYYNDFQRYPEAGNGGIGKLNYVKGCGAGGNEICPSTCLVDFAARGVGCDSVYMKKFPSELGTAMYYYQSASGEDFCLKVTLENKSDSDIAVSKSRCATACGSNCTGSSDYCVCAD